MFFFIIGSQFICKSSGRTLVRKVCLNYSDLWSSLNHIFKVPAGKRTVFLMSLNNQGFLAARITKNDTFFRKNHINKCY